MVGFASLRCPTLNLGAGGRERREGSVQSQTRHGHGACLRTKDTRGNRTNISEIIKMFNRFYGEGGLRVSVWTHYEPGFSKMYQNTINIIEK